MNGTFYEQIGGVANIFDSWTVCERTVVLCALLRRVPWSNLKLLKRAIESALMQHANAECQRLEAEANDALLLAKLVHSSEDDEAKVEIGDKLKKLLSYLPLLKPGNDKAKEIYLQSVPIIVQYSVDTAKYTDECQQLLSYLLIHPAVTGQDRRSLSQWLKFLENHISGNSNKDMWYQRIETSIAPNKTSWMNNNVSFRRTIGKNVEFKGTVDTISNRLEEFAKSDNLEESFSKNGKEMDLSIDNEPLTFDATITQPKSQRSNSLTPPTPNFIHMSSSAENLNSDQYFVQKPRSFSLSSEHSLASMKPIGVMLATGSETRLDDLKSHNFGDHAGMTTVAQWLKSLRLHKYVWLFSNISYDQMMDMSEGYLQELGVTKGARHKLLLSIKKLKERHALLEGMERELCTGSVMSSAGMNQLLEQLRNVIVSPMLPASELPKLVVRILELASTRLLSGGVLQPPHNSTPPARHQLEEHTTPAGLTCEPVSLHCWLVERALHHEAFNWSAEMLDSLRALRYRLPPKQFFNHLSDLPFTKRSVKPRWRANMTPHTPHHKPHLHTGHPTKRWSTHWLPLDTKQAARGKSSSYPSFPPSVPHTGLQPQPNLTCTPTVSASLGDINSRLESLCLQMTEQAIN